MTQEQTPALKVTQADRDAAGDYVRTLLARYWKSAQWEQRRQASDRPDHQQPHTKGSNQ